MQKVLFCFVCKCCSTRRRLEREKKKRTHAGAQYVKNTYHRGTPPKIVEVFAIEREGEHDRFADTGAKIANRKLVAARGASMRRAATDRATRARTRASCGTARG